ncbi:protein ADM2 [Monodelphis domestica]|uniref:Adrenomedullin 2 n=1 Tax=Monodelphis domestica TaxID=13616 RepID=F6RKW1_MONDO|nr:protein ADM2 [Monodelphis domestica]
MGWLLPVALGCISLLSLPLPSAQSRRLGPHPLLARPREPPDWLNPQDLESQAVKSVRPVVLVTQSRPHLEPLVGPLPRRPHSHRHLHGRLWGRKGRARGRGRRHTRRHGAKLMRVGCVLSTCQVQNLSHRLRQLMGQSGRQDSAPMNPKSPHSYG